MPRKCQNLCKIWCHLPSAAPLSGNCRNPQLREMFVLSQVAQWHQLVVNLSSWERLSLQLLMMSLHSMNLIRTLLLNYYVCQGKLCSSYSKIVTFFIFLYLLVLQVKLLYVNYKLCSSSAFSASAGNSSGPVAFPSFIDFNAFCISSFIMLAPLVTSNLGICSLWSSYSSVIYSTHLAAISSWLNSIISVFVLYASTCFPFCVFRC